MKKALISISMKALKHSGQVWSLKLRVPILSPDGWPSLNDFNHILITKEEFCNRAIHSELNPPTILTRREAAKTFKKI